MEVHHRELNRGKFVSLAVVVRLAVDFFGAVVVRLAVGVVVAIVVRLAVGVVVAVVALLVVGVIVAGAARLVVVSLVAVFGTVTGADAGEHDVPDESHKSGELSPDK